MERYFQISFHAMILSAFLALYGTGRVEALTLVIFMAGFVATAQRSLRGRPPLLTSRQAFYLSLTYVAFFVFDAMFVSRSFVAAIIHMVLFLELAKMAQRKNDKDYLYLILLAFLQVLAASSLTIDMSFVVMLSLFLVALVSTLMSFDVVRSERGHGTGKDPFEHRGTEAVLAGMSVWASLWIAVVSVGLFFAIPRIGTGYFSRAASQVLLISGFSERVSLGEIGEVKQSSALVMRTRVLEGSITRLPKWRGIALDTFDGTTWSQSPGRRSPIRRLGPDNYVLPESPDRPQGAGSGEFARFEVFLEPIDTTALFGPIVVRGIRSDFGGDLEQDSMGSIYQRAVRSRRIRYEVLSMIPNRLAPADVDDGEPGKPVLEDPDRYLQLPETLDPRIGALAATVTASGAGVMEKTSLIELFLKREFTYSLDLDWDPGDSPLSTFLFDVRSGHCEYFASSMAIMLRTIGIPTRIVNGFLTGEYNPVGESYTVRQSDAHSWVEVWVPGRGWVDFDPTPPDMSGGDLSLTRVVTQYMDAVDLFWNSYVLTYDSDLQFELFRSAQEAAVNLRADLENRSENWVTSTESFADGLTRAIERTVVSRIFWFAILLAVTGAVIVRFRRPLVLAWKLMAVRKQTRTADAEVIAVLFQRACRLAGRRVSARTDPETWREWIARIPDPGIRSKVGSALEIYERTQYGRGPVTEDDFARIEAVTQSLRQSLRGQSLPSETHDRR